MGWRGRRDGGSGWGTHVNPWLIHVNVCQKPLQYCKVISLQLIKINEKKKYDLMFKTYIWVKNLSAMQETQETRVQSLGQEDPLEETITHSSILA